TPPRTRASVPITRRAATGGRPSRGAPSPRARRPETAEVPEQDTPDLLDGFGMALHRVAGLHDQLRNRAVQMGAPVAHEPVPGLVELSAALRGDDRVHLHAGR